MFSIGINHFSTHIGLAPLRKFNEVNPDPKTQHRVMRIEPKIISVHLQAYQKQNFKYMVIDDDYIEESEQSTA